MNFDLFNINYQNTVNPWILLRRLFEVTWFYTMETSHNCFFLMIKSECLYQGFRILPDTILNFIYLLNRHQPCRNQSLAPVMPDAYAMSSTWLIEELPGWQKTRPDQQARYIRCSGPCTLIRSLFGHCTSIDLEKKEKIFSFAVIRFFKVLTAGKSRYLNSFDRILFEYWINVICVPEQVLSWFVAKNSNFLFYYVKARI